MKKITLKEELTSAQLEEIKLVLNAGGLILYPTETCYGAGVSATNPDAVTKLLRYKDRPVGKAISVAVSAAEQMYTLIEKNTTNQNIADKFLPGPITVVGNSLKRVDPRLESETGTLGIRIPAYKETLKLLSSLDYPLTATSANPQGGATPYDLDKTWNQLSSAKRNLIDLIIDAGELEHNPPSLVIDTAQIGKVYRPGLLTPEDIESGEVYDSISVESTKNIAAELSNYLVGIKPGKGVLILLEGEMGAGKTQFVAGLGEALGIKKIINSPTYTIVKEYTFLNNSLAGNLYHADLWRVTEDDYLDNLGIDLHREGLNIACVEWPDRLDLTDLSSDIMVIKVKLLKTGESTRKLVLTK